MPRFAANLSMLFTEVPFLDRFERAARTGFDAAAIQELEAAVPAADRSRADAEAAKIAQQMLKRHERFTPPKPAEFARGDGGNKSSYVAWQADYRHECQWNLKNNCAGAQRLIYVDLTNKNTEFQSCRVELRARDFVNGELVRSDPKSIRSQVARAVQGGKAQPAGGGGSPAAAPAPEAGAPPAAAPASQPPA